MGMTNLFFGLTMLRSLGGLIKLVLLLLVLVLAFFLIGPRLMSDPILLIGILVLLYIYIKSRK